MSVCDYPCEVCDHEDHALVEFLSAFDAALGESAFSLRDDMHLPRGRFFDTTFSEEVVEYASSLSQEILSGKDFKSFIKSFTEAFPRFSEEGLTLKRLLVGLLHPWGDVDSDIW